MGSDAGQPGAAPGGDRYLPALDGVRAVAIASVVAFHLGDGIAPGGYLGVDVFFVLSGFLITRLLLADQDRDGRISLRSFWSRRARRLLPGLMLLLAVLGLVSAVVPEAVNPFQLRSDGLAALFYVANWHLLATGGSYFASLGLPDVLQHTWSLGVEEQFYLCWPLVLAGVAGLTRRLALRRDRRRRPDGRGEAGRGVAGLGLAAGITGALALGSVVAMVVVYDGGRGLDAAYYGTECRAFELLTGALVAFFLAWRQPAGGRATEVVVAGPRENRGSACEAAAPLSSRPARTGRAWSLLGLAAFAGLVAAIVGVSGPAPWLFEGGLTLVALATAVVLLVATGPGPLGRLLSLRPLRWLGRISYECYLWHWPVIVVTDAELHWTGAGRAALVVAVTLVLSAGSHYLVDAPLRRASYSSLRRRLALPAAVSAIAAVLVFVPSTIVVAAPTPALALGTLASGGTSVSAASSVTPASSGRVFGVRLAPPIGTIRLGFRPSRRHRLRVMFVGDSVMYQLELAIGAALESTGEVTVASYSAIEGWSPRNHLHSPAIEQAISRTRPGLVVAMWTQDNTWVGAHGVAAYEKATLGPFLETLMGRHDGVKGVVFLGEPPQPPANSWMPNVHADVYDPAGMLGWEQAAVAETRLHPGRVAFAPATAMLEYHGRYSTWLPSPTGALERVRQIDDFHLCLNGGVRYGAGAAAQVARLFDLRSPTPGWWLGPFASARRWYRLSGYPPGQCPQDAPAHLG